MSAVLHIALGAFSMVPLQRVLNFIGAAIVLPALAWALVNPAHAPIAIFFMFMGILLIVLPPFVGGGAALRYASTKSMLHLRPNGRLYMLLGALLAITLIAALIALPMFVLEWIQPRGVKLPVPGATLFPVMWLCAALTWVGMFGLLSGHRALLPMAFVIPLAIGPIAQYVGTSSFGMMCFALAALGTIVAFPVWYARTDRVRRPGMGADCAPAPWGFPGNGIGQQNGPLPSRTGVLRQYLQGSASLATPIWSSLLLVFFMGLMTTLPLMMGKPWQGFGPFLFLVLAALGITATTMGHTVARRARLLWLRAGLDRDGLFLLAEREGLISTALAYIIPMAVLLGAAFVTEPEQISAHLAFGLATLALAQCLFHAGLSTTHNWDFRDVALTVFLAMLQILLIVMALPGEKHSIAWALGFTLVFAGLTPALRGHARRRWQTLDWRVMRMMQTGR